MFSLQNKSVVVTGGGSGIGKAIAEIFAKQGAVVHIIELNTIVAKEVVKTIEAEGGKAVVHSCDVSNQVDVIHAFGEIGTVDILINND